MDEDGGVPGAGRTFDLGQDCSPVRDILSLFSSWMIDNACEGERRQTWQSSAVCHPSSAVASGYGRYGTGIYPDEREKVFFVHH